MSEQEYCIKHDYFFHGDPDDCPLCEVDDLKEEITRLRAQLAESQKREQELLSERKGEGVRTRRAIAEAKKKWLAEAEGQEPVGRIVKTTVNAGVCELISHHVVFYRDMAGGEELYTRPAPAKVPDESELVHIGYTNGAQVLYCVTGESGSFYPDTENDTCIPVYMLRTHAHRLESTTNGQVTLDRIKREWDMLKSQGGG
ncbi:hypothetical protein [Zhongshania sp.]|uniref:hypothetical protein n=1 Tax=Zhongshania sp. TaxID=1971902 RepID=UPI0035671610